MLRPFFEEFPPDALGVLGGFCDMLFACPTGFRCLKSLRPCAIVKFVHYSLSLSHAFIQSGTMQIWPAIDLRGGKCVRLQQGDYARETVFF